MKYNQNQREQPAGAVCKTKSFKKPLLLSSSGSDLLLKADRKNLERSDCVEDKKEGVQGITLIVP